MAHFYQLKGDQATFNRCMAAIKQACSTELWLDHIVAESERRQSVCSSTNVLLHWWQSFKETDINFMYINTCKDKAEYYYEDSTGKMLHIAEQGRDHAHVYHVMGFPDSLVEELEGTSHEQLYDLIETKVSQFINEDDFELKITKSDNS